MAYKDDYYTEVDDILNKMKPNPFEGADPNVVRHEDEGQIQPVGWVENADGADGAATVKINADGITVTEGAITVADSGGTTTIDGGIVKTAGIEAGAITTAKLNASAVISLVTNSGATVVIDASGITITGGAISVSNGSGTVIIDGTSNMFKIQATGTLSHTVADNTDTATTSTTLTGLGALATTPAHVSLISGTNSTTGRWTNAFAQSDASDYVSGSSGGSPDLNRVVATVAMRIATSLDGSNQCVVESRMTTAGAGGSTTWYGRYYVLKEAAL